jgi:hypothetical protein
VDSSLSERPTGARRVEDDFSPLIEESLGAKSVLGPSNPVSSRRSKSGITVHLEAGGTLENAQAMAAHESPCTTKLYDRTGDEIMLDEVERISI